jgi:formylglycine-generating enzyme required for sulfatase activity
MSDHEVTQAEFQAVMGINPSYFNGTSGREAAAGETQTNRPVEQVSWYDAITYCNKKSIADGLNPCYSISGITDWANLAYGSIPTSGDATWNAVICNFTANGYRLPTEAEWEYAALGGAAGVSAADPTDYAGTNDSASLGNYAWNSSNSSIKTHEVKKKSPNAINLFDMSGNVFEWCWDWDGTISSSTPAAGAPSGANRVFRGSSYVLTAVYCSAAYRIRSVPYMRDSNNLGFRVCRTAQ